MLSGILIILNKGTVEINHRSDVLNNTIPRSGVTQSCTKCIQRLLKAHGWDKAASNEDDSKPGEPLPITPTVSSRSMLLQDQLKAPQHMLSSRSRRDSPTEPCLVRSYMHMSHADLTVAMLWSLSASLLQPLPPSTVAG